LRRLDDSVWISALRGDGIDTLTDMMATFFANLREEVVVTLPAARGDLVAAAWRDGQVLSEEYQDGCVVMRARVTRSMAGRLRKAAAAIQA